MNSLVFLLYLSYFSIFGTVRDAETGSPVVGAVVYVKGHSGAKASTDVYGKFVLEDLPGGLQTLVVQAPGYASLEFGISDFAESPIELLLTKASAPQPQPLKDKTKPKERPGDRQPRSSKDTLVLPLSDTVGMDLEQVLVRAVRAEEDLPVTASQWNRADIERRYQGQDMPVLLLQQPSVTAYTDNGTGNGYAYFRLRGIDPTRLNMTLNGAPLNEPEDQGVYFSNFVDFANNLQSIQVQRGTGTSSHGTSAYGGALHFESRRLAEARGGEVQAGYGSYGTYRTSAAYATGLLPNRFAFYSRFSLFGTQGYRRNSSNRSLSFFLSGGYLGERDMVKITAFSGWSRNQMCYLPAKASDLAQDQRINYLSPDERDNFIQHYVQAQYVRTLGARFSLSATGFYSHIDGDYDLMVSYSDMLNLALRSHFAGGFAHLNYKHGRIELHVGGQGNFFRRRHRLAQKPWTEDFFYSNFGNKTEASGFAKLRWQLHERVLFYADLQGRYARFAYTPDAASAHLPFAPISWAFFNPKLGFNVQAAPVLSFYACAGAAGREPTRTDLLGAYDDVDAGNFDQVGDFGRVLPEYVIDAELGVRLHSRKLNLQWNAYYMHFRNEIAAIGQLNLFGIPLRRNVPLSYRAGAELELAYSPVSVLSLRLTACYNYHRIVEYKTEYDTAVYKNVRPLLTPDCIANAGLEYAPLPWLSLSVSARYQSPSYLDNSNRSDWVLPWFVVGDARLNLRYKRHDLAVFVNNFTNARYAMSGSVLDGQAAYYRQAGINVQTVYTFRF